MELTFSVFLIFIYLFLAAQGLCCCVGFSLVVASGGYSLVSVHGLLLIAVASLLVEHGLEAHWLQLLTCRLSCSTACGIFPDQGLNPALAGGFLTPGPPGAPLKTYHHQ